MFRQSRSTLYTSATGVPQQGAVFRSIDRLRNKTDPVIKSYAALTQSQLNNVELTLHISAEGGMSGRDFS